MLHDDGPVSGGGHEPEGATAGDHVWRVAVWVTNSQTWQLEYGAISSSVEGSDGAWVWTGANGSIQIPAAATGPITAPGLTID